MSRNITLRPIAVGSIVLLSVLPYSNLQAASGDDERSPPGQNIASTPPMRPAARDVRPVDDFGFRIDRFGNLYDRDGHQVKPNLRAITW